MKVLESEAGAVPKNLVREAMSTPADLNSWWRGLTLVRQLHLDYFADRGSFELTLHLSESVASNARSAVIVFSDVGELTVKAFGGGLSQFLHLTLSDESDRGLDRIKYFVRELERDAISFTCSGFSVSPA